MHEIYVDADACPVKDEVLKVAGRHKWQIHMVSNSWMRLADSSLINRVVVPEGPDVADDWIAERIGAGDVCVTQDIPLASRCMSAGAEAMSPTGKRHSEDSIGMAVAMRDLHTELRETGEITGGPKPFAKQDRSRFLQSLEESIQSILRNR